MFIKDRRDFIFVIFHDVVKVISLIKLKGCSCVVAVFKVLTNSFDGRGNYTMGIKEQLIFSEIDYDDVVKVRGMDIVFVTTAKTNEEAFDLLDGLGIPFRK